MITPHLADVWEAVAAAVPDRPAVSQGARTLTWTDYEDRAARLAGALHDLGVGPGTKVGLYLHDAPEYLIAQFAAFKLRAVPVNISFRYVEAELLYLLENSDAEVVVFDDALAGRIEAVREQAPGVRVWISTAASGPGPQTHVLDDLMTRDPMAPIERRGDDLYVLYTGGTTGMPKGVMFAMDEFTHRWRRAAQGALGETPGDDLEWCARAARELAEEDRSPVWLTTCPLMHGTGMWVGAFVPHMAGGHTVLLPPHGFDPARIGPAVERHRIRCIAVAGDAIALPWVTHLEERASREPDPQLATLERILSSGVLFSPELKDRLLAHLSAGARIIDGLGSTEGPMGTAISTKDAQAGGGEFVPDPRTKVLADDGTPVVPGSGQVGNIAVSGPGNVPLGYYKDPEKTAKVIRTYDGVRYSLPGDVATVAADGRIQLLGRGSSCINTGGEKVFPEEVELVLKSSDMVDDTLVFGADHPRFGQQVVALVVPASPDADPVGILEHARTRIASYKVPRIVQFCDHIPRTASGKADYPLARAVFAELNAT